jgi:hypothetical protein
MVKQVSYWTVRTIMSLRKKLHKNLCCDLRSSTLRQIHKMSIDSPSKEGLRLNIHISRI